MKNKWVERMLILLVFLTILTPIWVFKDLLFPFVTSKAFVLRIAVELALPFYLFLLVTKKQARPNLKNPISLVVLIFGLINLISSVLGVNVTRSLWGNFERMGGMYYILHLILLYFYLLTLSQLNPKVLAVFLKTLAWFAGILSFYGVMIKLGMTPIIVDPSLPNRISIFFGNPIYVGSFMILPMFLAVFFAFQSEEIWEKIAFWILAFLQIMAIYLSGTRGAVVGLMVGLFLGAVAYVFMVRNKQIRIWGGIVIIIVFGLAGILYSKHESLPQGSTLKRVFNLNDSNTQSRLIQWKTALGGLPEYWFSGTGPENYYIVGNKYHNPEISKYDRSWFDKPHNFLLEVLLTTGVFGFIAYLAIIISSIYGAYLAFKANILSLMELIVLATGIVVYQLQNLFVFDNVSTTLTFFVYTVFCAFLYQEGKKQNSEIRKVKEKLLKPNINLGFAVLCVSGVVVIYAIWATNILPMKAAKAVNYGYAYASVDKKKSLEYFKQAINTPFNFDYGETSMRFSELGSSAAQEIAQNRNSQDKNINELNNEILSTALNALKNTVERVDNYPIYWYRYANLIYFNDMLLGRPLSGEGEEAISKAIELAPKRTEARLFLVQIRMSEQKYSEGLELMRQIITDDPNNLDYQWYYANFLAQAGNTNQAVVESEQLFAKDYHLRSWQDSNWLVSLYLNKKEYQKAIQIYARLADDQKLDADGFFNLATIYAQSGDKARAKDLVQKIMQSDSKYSQKGQEFLKTLEQK